MEFWLFMAGVILLFFILPYIRCFFKRLRCSRQIKRVCRDKGYILHKNHAFWFLGSNNGKRCDCYVETGNEIFAIKLFGMTRKGKTLVFLEERGYFIRRFMAMEIRLIYSFDGRVKEFPKYDFEYNNADSVTAKHIRKILLVNPVPREMRMQARNSKETIVSPGDVVYDLEIFNLSGLVNKLKG